MLLVIDVGNSAVKGGLFDGAELIRVFTVDEGGEEGPTSVADWTEALRPRLQDVSVAGIGLASVVPRTADAVTEALARLTDAPVTTIRATMPLPFELAYETPDALGADRLAAAAAAWRRYGVSGSPPRSVLVVDAGTAVTCEVIHRDGVYQGGTIGAGPALVRQALTTGTAQLSDVPLTVPDDPVGRSTQDALRSGIMWGLIEGIDGLLERLADGLPDAPFVVGTGGWAPLLADHLSRVDRTAPHLVLKGIRDLVVESPE